MRCLRELRRRLPIAMLPLLAAVLLAACASSGPGQERPLRAELVEREVVVDGTRHRYRVFVPGTAAPHGAPRPVVLFLHGSGERGSDGERQTRVGLGPYLRDHGDGFPAIAVFPQAPEDTEWSDSAGIAMAALEDATRAFGGDPDRTYLTGLSMGGYGVWELALAHPRRFAALVPVCGGLQAPAHRPTLFVTAVQDEPDPFAAAAGRLRHLPTWIFHGALDDLVLPEQSRRMAAALEAAGAADAHYTEFPDANHNSWDATYATPELWDWLFAQRRH